MAFLLPAAVLLLPLLILPGLLFHYDITPKVLILCLAAAAALLRPKQIAEEFSALWNKKDGRLLCLIGTAQVIWYVLVTALSSRPWFSLLGSNWRRMGLITVLALSLFALLAAAHLCRVPGSSRAVLRAFAVAAILASIYGILQYFDIDPLQDPMGYHAQAGNSTIVRPPGTLGHADYFGWWLAIAVFCGIALGRIESGFWRAASIAASALSCVATVLSGTRSAMLAVVAGFGALAFLSGWRPARRHTILAVSCLILLLVFVVSPPGTRLRARVRWSADEPIGGARPLLWRDSLRMAAAHPLIGSGPETFSSAFPHYQSPELAHLFPDFYHESPHNTALDALTSEGIPGLLLALAWVATGWRASSSQTAPLAAALIASCVASLFTAVTVGPVFATLLVIAILISSTPDGEPSRPKVSTTAVLAISIPIALCLAIFSVALIRAEYRLARFQSAPSDPAVELKLYDTAFRASLPGASEDLYCSRRLAASCATAANPVIGAACIEVAIHAAARATATADNPPNAWYNLAILSAAHNDAAKVETALRTAATEAPNWFRPHWALANLLALTGRADEARTQATAAFQLDAGKDADVRQTFLKLTK